MSSERELVIEDLLETLLRARESGMPVDQLVEDHKSSFVSSLFSALDALDQDSASCIEHLEQSFLRASTLVEQSLCSSIALAIQLLDFGGMRNAKLWIERYCNAKTAFVEAPLLKIWKAIGDLSAAVFKR